MELRRLLRHPSPLRKWAGTGPVAHTTRLVYSSWGQTWQIQNWRSQGTTWLLPPLHRLQPQCSLHSLQSLHLLLGMRKRKRMNPRPTGLRGMNSTVRRLFQLATHRKIHGYRLNETSVAVLLLHVMFIFTILFCSFHLKQFLLDFDKISGGCNYLLGRLYYSEYNSHRHKYTCLFFFSFEG